MFYLKLIYILFYCSDTKYHNRTILLFTNDCNPHKDDPKEQQLARIKAKDLADIGIQLQLLHLGTDFDAAVFYQVCCEYRLYFNKFLVHNAGHERMYIFCDVLCVCVTPCY